METTTAGAGSGAKCGEGMRIGDERSIHSSSFASLPAIMRYFAFDLIESVHFSRRRAGLGLGVSGVVLCSLLGLVKAALSRTESSYLVGKTEYRGGCWSDVNERCFLRLSDPKSTIAGGLIDVERWMLVRLLKSLKATQSSTNYLQRSKQLMVWRGSRWRAP
jgi:hypothetical protein